MLISALAKPLAITGAAVLWVGVPTMLPSSNGVWSFTPTNFCSSGTSCSTCHTGSAPSAQSSRTSLTADAGITALSAGQSIQLTTALDATGANTTFGGFVCEASGGSFTAGANTQTTTNGLSTISVSHIDKNSRAWTYTFNAPTSPGLVELTSAGLAVNNDGQAFVAGDHVSFSGFDNSSSSSSISSMTRPPGRSTPLKCRSPYTKWSRCPPGASPKPEAAENSALFPPFGLPLGRPGLWSAALE